MTERATIAQVCQIGLEADPGTLVPATRRLAGLSIEPGIKVEANKFRPMGSKYQTIVVPGKEWTEAPLKGAPTYGEIVYPLSSILKKVVPVRQGETAAYRWTFDPSSTDEDEVQTFTVEQGSSVRAHRFGYGIVKDLSLSFDRQKLELGGALFGQALEDGVALSEGCAELDLLPILPGQLDVYLDDLVGDLGNTQLLRVLRGSWSLTNRFGQVWPVDSSKASFAAHVEIEPTAQVKLRLAADAQGMGLLVTLRAGSTKFLRLKAEGDTIADAYKYLFQFDGAVKVSEPSTFEDEDGVYAIEWTCESVHDGAWGRAFSVDVVNTLAAL